MRLLSHIVASISALSAVTSAVGINCWSSGRGPQGLNDRPIRNMIAELDAHFARNSEDNPFYYSNEYIICDYNNKGEPDRSDAVYCASWKYGVVGPLMGAREELQRLLDYGCTTSGTIPINGGDDIRRDGALGVDSVQYDYYSKFMCPNVFGNLVMKGEDRVPICVPLHYLIPDTKRSGGGKRPEGPMEWTDPVH